MRSRRRPPLTIKQVLAWADTHHARTGKWPTEESGPVVEAPGEVWQNIAWSLRDGTRGLSGKRTLAQLLVAERGVRKRAYAPRLTVKKILRWADAHYKRTGAWPKSNSGPVSGVPSETWIIIDLALRKGIRGLHKSTLPRLLADHRGVRNVMGLPRLTIERILKWADAHWQRTGKWPSCEGGPLHDAPGETWQGIDRALRNGHRGLPGGSSLAQLLAKERNVRNQASVPPLTEKQIRRWAEEHRRRTGDWPKQRSGPVEGAPGEMWSILDQALRNGSRGLPGGSSLAKLLGNRRT